MKKLGTIANPQVEQARQKEGVLYFPFVGLPCVEVAWNVLRLCDGRQRRI